ncbi:hypothetical protein FJT64_017069 [Amphibalanus amphitrite]|uniref:DRBM domain-containing protein n=1 Tax=Amphibalanus amphitrite TaxID=1232801 RepID=A0A6A4WX99_AMPAM|nr:hypothetical protein FJT64_017069 [Amphibalanus amphitrite]
MPATYSRKDIPAERHLIPRAETIDKWPHLKTVSEKLPPYFPAAGQFVCELTVSGCSFKPIGVGARKAAAKEDAAAQLVKWLRQAGRWEPSEAASPSRAVPPTAAVRSGAAAA